MTYIKHYCNWLKKNLVKFRWSCMIVSKSGNFSFVHIFHHGENISNTFMNILKFLPRGMKNSWNYVGIKNNRVNRLNISIGLLVLYWLIDNKISYEVAWLLGLFSTKIPISYVLYLRWKLKWWLHNLTLMFNLFTALSLVGIGAHPPTAR